MGADTAALLASLDLQDKLSPKLKSAMGNVSQAETGFGRLSAGASRFASNLSGGVSRAVGTFGGRLKQIGFGLTAALGVGGLFSLGSVLTGAITRMRDFGETVDKAMGITGLGVEKASALAAALSYVGISGESVIKSLGMAEKNLFKLAGTTQKATKFQKLYGLSLVDSKGKLVDANELLLRSADFYTKNKNRAQVAAAMAAIYGKSWQNLIEVFELGRTKIQAAEAMAAKLGLTLSGKNLNDILKYRDVTRDLGTAFGGLQLQIGLALLPRLTDLSVWATGFISTHGPQITKFFKDAADFAGKAAGTIGTFVGAVQTFWGGIPGPLRDLLVKGIIADRTIKFFFGISPIKLVASLAADAIGGIVKGLGTAVAAAVVGAGLGKAFVQPVWVTNPNFGGPGGNPLNNIVPAAEGAGAAGAAEGIAGAGLRAALLGAGALFAGIVGTIIAMDVIPLLTKGAPGSTDRNVGPTTAPGSGTSAPTFGALAQAGFTNVANIVKVIPVGGAMSVEDRTAREPLIKSASTMQDVKDASQTTAAQLKQFKSNSAADSARLQAALAARMDMTNSKLERIKDKDQSVRVNVTYIANTRISVKDITQSILTQQSYKTSTTVTQS